MLEKILPPTTPLATIIVHQCQAGLMRALISQQIAPTMEIELNRMKRNSTVQRGEEEGLDVILITICRQWWEKA